MYYNYYYTDLSLISTMCLKAPSGKLLFAYTFDNKNSKGEPIYNIDLIMSVNALSQTETTPVSYSQITLLQIR